MSHFPRLLISLAQSSAMRHIFQCIAKRVLFTTGICPPDAITFDYVQQRTDAPFDAVQADAGASYVEEYRFDVSKLEPLVAAPHSPDNRKKAAECSNVNIDRVYIGQVPLHQSFLALAE